MLLLSTGQSCHQGAAAQRAEGVHQQGALQRGLRRVSHRPLGLARGLARALQPAHGHAGQRRRQRRARSHESAHRCVLPCLLWEALPCASFLTHCIQIEEIGIFFLSSPWAWCLLLAVESCSAGVMRAGEGDAVLQVRARQGLGL